MKKLLLGLLAVTCSYAVQAQVISQWNFNASNTTPTVGSGVLVNVNTTTAFYSGNGSSDTASTSNKAFATKAYPSQGSGSGTAGIQFGVSTVGYENILVSFDAKTSNTASKYWSVEYTTDLTAATPVWIQQDTLVREGSSFRNNKEVNFSNVTALNNNPNAGFRIVSIFEPGTTAYDAAGATSNYGTGGTMRFDMLTVRSLVPNANVELVTTEYIVNENVGRVQLVAKLLSNHPDSTRVGIGEVLNSGTAVNGLDYSIDTANAVFSWVPNSLNITDTVSITIIDDAAPENVEYFNIELTNPTNINLPESASNFVTVFIKDNDNVAFVPSDDALLSSISSIATGDPATNSAEILAYDSATQRLFVANSKANKIHAYNFNNPANMVLLNTIDLSTYGKINSIASKNGIIAAALENANPQLNGSVVFFDSNLVYKSQIATGAMPDMLTFSADGNKVITANEGEPNDAYTVDPEGSVTVVDISSGVTTPSATTINFNSFDAQKQALIDAGVRIYGPNATVSQDLEPEYIAISTDGDTAYVSCQENNAIAVIDLANNTAKAIRPLGTKFYVPGQNAFDYSDKNDDILISNWPVQAYFMPDAIALTQIGGVDYILTANEGDARDYAGYSEETRLGKSAYPLDSVDFPNHAILKKQLKRLKVTTANGDTDNDGLFEEIYIYGGRSFSIRNAATNELVWDSGDMIERIIATHPEYNIIFNANNDDNVMKKRSDDKGPEPEGIQVAVINGQTIAFVGLERVGGVMAFDITNPQAPVYVDYLNTRNLATYGGDNGPEGMLYIQKTDRSPINSYLVVANEVSSTIAVSGVGAVTPLPIYFESITAENVNSYNVVNWTATVKGADAEMLIERSSDGKEFVQIGAIEAQETSQKYSFIDKRPLEGVNFYRVKFIENGHAATYSRTVLAKYLSENSVIAYPNPAKDFLTVRVASGVATYTLMTIEGNVVKGGTFSKVDNRIDLRSLRSGQYILKVTNQKDATTIIKVVKK